MFINMHVHITVCMKRAGYKTACTLLYDFILSIRLNSYTCIYRPKCSGLASLGAGILDDIYLLIYLLSSFLKFYSGHVIFL